MNNIVFLRDLAVVMMAAGIAALVCQWLKQPKVLGYIVAGLIIGPRTQYCLGLVTNEASILTLSDVGMIFLMLSMGFEFNLRKLTSVGLTAFITAIVDVVFMFWMGFVIGRILGWNVTESVFLGAIICSSSTAVVARLLDELGQLKERYASIILGATILEDVAAIVLLAVVTGIGITGAVQAGEVGLRIGELVTFLVAVLLIGVFVVRRGINYVARFGNDELLLLIVLAICFTVSLMAVRLEFSLALGAFIVGAVISETKPADRLALFIQPIRNVFAPMFFVAIGMTVDPSIAIGHVGTIILLIAAVILGKVAGSSCGAFISGNDRKTSFRVGCGMAQICEFALIIAALGRSLHVTSDALYSIGVTVSVATVAAGSNLLRRSEDIFTFIDSHTPQSLARATSVYTRWIRNVMSLGGNDAIRRTVRRSLLTIAVNLALIVAVFITVTLLSRFGGLIHFMIPDYLGGAKGLLWMCGALVTIPLYVATIRKLQAVAMVAAELKFPVEPASSQYAAIARTLSEKVIVFAGIVALGIFTLMLSSALLPPFHVLTIMLILLSGITALFWKFQIRLYSRAQGILRDTFSEPAKSLYVEPLDAIPYVFQDARLSSVVISASSASAARTIGELNIRRETGATIVGIERNGGMIVNPEASEMMQPGDKLFLLGLQNQIESATRVICMAAPGAKT